MASDPSKLFTPGASLDAPKGDVEREAIASLKGYAYQVAVATLAWLDLDERGKLYLEVAEDYAILAGQTLTAVQSKDTAASGTVTLNTATIRDAVAAFVDLSKKNKDRKVVLRYLTTSAIGTEQKASSRPAGQAGLIYWRQAAAGADVAPLREILVSKNFSSEVREYVKARNPEEIRRDLLQRIHWDCGEPDLDGVTRELEERLVILGRDKFGLTAPEARRLTDRLIYQVLEKSILKDRAERVLTRADLYAAIDAATHVAVPRQTADAMFRLVPAIAGAMPGPHQTADFSTADTSWIIPSDELPEPRAIISRVELSAKIASALAKHGRVILVGGSGLGKSLIAREVARKAPGGFAIIDLRDTDAPEALRRLDLTLGRLGTIPSDCLIFDDFNSIEDGRARIGFGRCLQALQRRDRTAIVTLYRRPSHRALTEIGLDPKAVFEIPYFTQGDADEIVRATGGEPDPWGKIAFTAGAQGHPQLVHAFATGMAARGWPSKELRDVIIRGFSSDDIDGERDAARRSMVTALSDDARALLYRLSLVIGRFNRELALKISQSPPAISRSGERLDELIGPWVEGVGKDAFRVSPLAGNAGKGMLSPEAQRAVHKLIAQQMLSARKINASDANAILTHALMGKSEPSLMAMAYSVLTAETKIAEMLAEQFFVLRILRTDQAIYPDNTVVSVHLRMAQFKLLATKGDSKEVSACADALLREVADETVVEVRDLLEATALALILHQIGIASSVQNWVDLLQQFKAKAAYNPALNGLRTSISKASRALGGTFFGWIFAIGSGHLASVRRLEEILLDLDRLDKADRSLWLENFDRKPSDYSILVNHPWVAEKDELKPAEAAERYKRMSALALKWNNRPLTAQCIAARAVMFDEYLGDERAAHAAIDDGIAALGEHVVLLRARAKIFWRGNKHVEAVKILREIADQVGRDSPIDRAFALREAAISAAKTNDWAQADVWFADAQKAAASVKTDDMEVMAVGLQADRAIAAFNIGKIGDALSGMAACLDSLRKIKPDASLRAAYCHRVVRHSVLWMESQIDHRETLIGGEPIGMLPGACSNPEPPPSITELPLGPLDLAWYMLAEAEISSGIDVGIESALLSKLEGGPILYLEIAKPHRKLSYDVVTTNILKFPTDFSEYLAAWDYLRLHGQAMQTSFDVMSPQRGKFPALTSAQMTDPNVTRVAIDALIAFALAAVLQQKADPVVDLQSELIGAFGANFPGKSAIDRLTGIPNSLSPIDETMVESIKLMRSGAHIDPRKIWEIGLRIFEKIRQSDLRGALLPLLSKWLRAHWRQIIEKESFRLSRPMQTIPTIEGSLAKQQDDKAFIASLLLSTAEAVGSPLAAAYEQQLKEMARSG